METYVLNASESIFRNGLRSRKGGGVSELLQRQQREGPQGNLLQRFADDCAVSGLGDTKSNTEREYGQSKTGNESQIETRGSGLSFWSNAICVPCKDGKQRRISPEPESFPLAHGVPGRVGLLRGYGNAIVPQVAAEFIKAYEECDR